MRKFNPDREPVHAEGRVLHRPADRAGVRALCEGGQETSHGGGAAATAATGVANAWHNAFVRLVRCYERREIVVEALFDFADAIITIRSLFCRAWTTHRWDTRPQRRR